jgi:hypothetical protein
MTPFSSHSEHFENSANFLPLVQILIIDALIRRVHGLFGMNVSKAESDMEQTPRV